MFEFLLQHYNYWMFIGLMMIGFYAMMAKRNLIKKIIGMNIFQSAIILFFISTSVKSGGVTVPILEYPHTGAKAGIVDVMGYANPLPHVLMLTAIVVGVATTALALSLVVRINEAYETIEEDELRELEREEEV